MHFDFSAFLVIATLFTGLVWVLDVIFLKPARVSANKDLQPDNEAYARESVLVEYSRSFFPVILLVLILRSFMYEPFKIPSGSMMPTLLIGDFILVNKYAYGIRIPVLEWEVIDIGKPERGDVAVFRFPSEPSKDFIKRVIGLPGDEVAYVNKNLFINGVKIEKTPNGQYLGETTDSMMSPMNEFQQKIGNHQVNILEMGRTGIEPEGSVRVPAGHYFVMGDNRDQSHDSRYWGFVPVDNLVGRADMIWLSWNSKDSRIRFERIGNDIE
ncbi:MAG: signal peptidase I [Gammaproteobacteria bacterium]|nr:MAG: signal peptidase I [Gammaproteobacteria bacterium]